MNRTTTVLFILLITSILLHEGCGGDSGDKDLSKFYPLTGSPYGVVDADLNGDGLKDIAVIIKYSGLYIYFNKGKSLSSEPVRLSYLPYGTAIDTGDFNGDSIPDLAYIVENCIQVLINDGTGRSFNSSLVLPGPLFSFSLKTPDLNNDGISDIVAVGIEDDEIYIYLSSGPLEYNLIKLDMPDDPMYFDFSAKTLSVGDVDGDGFVDILVPEFKNNALWLIRNKGGAGFTPELILTLPPDDKILYAHILTYDQKTNTALIAVVSGTYDPRISVYSISSSITTFVETKTLPYPYPVHIYPIESSNSTVGLIITHLRSFEYTGGAITYLRLNTNTFSLSDMEVMKILPSYGIMSIYIDDLRSILTVCQNPDGLLLLKAGRMVI